MPQEILDIPKCGPINVHPSILPAYRGPSPVKSALLNNETETGITIMYMNDKLDEGDIISILKFPLPFSRTEQELMDKMMSS